MQRLSPFIHKPHKIPMEPAASPESVSSKWYCLKCQPRMEALATESLRRLPDVEVFYPLTVRTKKTPSGNHQVRRPLFPGYLFSSFDPVQSMRAVNYCQGIAYVVRHGVDPVEVFQEIIEELKSITDQGFLQMPSRKPSIGQSVRILHGLFDGNEATVARLIPEKKRIEVLLEILGSPCLVRVDEELVDAGAIHPLTAPTQD